MPLTLFVEILNPFCNPREYYKTSSCGKNRLTSSRGSVIYNSTSGALQMVRGSSKDRSAVYGIGYTDISFLWNHGCVRRNKGIRRNTETSLVIYGRIRNAPLMFYLYTLLMLAGYGWHSGRR